ncbi:hypothetical protein RAJCM14343_4363 [Rhodococcus aetherivorans]|uniref:Uncharacterized protein n=1 Tax=Rhodococcus aetherivorans TaxID=191292 RepID=A0ABQ0YRR8_9NOCA|nr:hypothetical protein RAJCM14343_4363 [Rhodococcus aetherivorans]
MDRWILLFGTADRGCRCLRPTPEGAGLFPVPRSRCRCGLMWYLHPHARGCGADMSNLSIA